MGDIDPKIVKKTQDLLGKIIKKPPLTDKLLSRPPFRFLHDVVTSFIRSTGIMKGLFTTDELTADNVKEKEAKLQFLKKIVDFLTVVNSRAPNIRISSVIAGKEADKTNFLLQMLADCANKGINNVECVTKALSFGKGDAPPKAEKKESKQEPVSKPQTETVKRRSDGDRRVDRTKKTNSRTRSREIDESANKIADRPKEKKNNAHLKDSSPVAKPNEKLVDQKKELFAEEPAEIASLKKKTPGVIEDKVIPATIEEPGVILTRNSRPPSAKGQRKPSEVSANNSPVQLPIEQEKLLSPVESVKAHNISNPLSARTNETIEPREIDLNSKVSLVTGMLIENEIDSDDDDNFIIEENITGVQNGRGSGGFEAENDMMDENGQHGGLVTKLLQSKNELAGGNLVQSDNKIGKAGAVGLTTVIDEAAKKRERAATEREMERLCQALQDLTRSALPLGKLMDFLQEDLESMQMEYKEWKKEEQQLAQQLKLVESRTDSNLDPMRTELLQLEEKQLEYRKAIANAKANVLQNDTSIQQMLTQVVERA